MAFSSSNSVKDVYRKAAQCKHPEVKTRNFVPPPPQFYSRYMYLSKICKHIRDSDKDTKTQIRFGKTDVEILTKKRGQNEAFKITDLNDICKIEDIPKYDEDIKWRGKN